MAEVKLHEFKVKMTCEGCSGAVQRVLTKLKDNPDKKVEDFDISLADQSVKVKTSLSANEVLEVIKKTGKEAEFIKSE
nr:unnamed protein product [Callosobruchus analis]